MDGDEQRHVQQEVEEVERARQALQHVALLMGRTSFRLVTGARSRRPALPRFGLVRRAVRRGRRRRREGGFGRRVGKGQEDVEGAGHLVEDLGLLVRADAACSQLHQQLVPADGVRVLVHVTLPKGL